MPLRSLICRAVPCCACKLCAQAEPPLLPCRAGLCCALAGTCRSTVAIALSPTAIACTCPTWTASSTSGQTWWLCSRRGAWARGRARASGERLWLCPTPTRYWRARWAHALISRRNRRATDAQAKEKVVVAAQASWRSCTHAHTRTHACRQAHTHIVHTISMHSFQIALGCG